MTVLDIATFYEHLLEYYVLTPFRNTRKFIRQLMSVFCYQIPT